YGILRITLKLTNFQVELDLIEGKVIIMHVQKGIETKNFHVCMGENSRCVVSNIKKALLNPHHMKEKWFFEEASPCTYLIVFRT
ncbi:hypothetical protein ACA29_04640, partial [Lederbergia galactosidilytica]